MYTRDTLVLLKHFLESGLSKTAIADQLGISRRLVYHLIETKQLDREMGEAPCTSFNAEAVHRTSAMGR